MGIKLKNLNEQVIVVTGASSGIGLTTARMAAGRGAKLVLAARNQEVLKKLAGEIDSAGGRAIYVAADVGRESDVRKIASAAIAEFGRFDTWVNNAGVSIYGKFVDVPFEDQRQLFETNYWGVVYGSLAAAEHLRAAGGAIVNVGSTLSDRAIPLQGTYCASKHAVKGFTDAFRMELESENAPISVSLIKPAAIDTPYKDHARNYLGVKAENPPPVYAPETVAEAILHCAENAERDVFVGGAGKAASFFGRFAPRLTDVVMEKTMLGMEKPDEPTSGNPQESLYESKDSSMRERGGYAGHVMESSIYTKASLHPAVTGAALLALGAGLGYTLLRRSHNK
jgi:short-subunit dehydrogenase